MGISQKKIGTDFEREACNLLASKGYWVHFLAPDARGAQPFDIIAVKNGYAFAIDCKTCESNTFNISRLEENQIMAFEYWISKGNTMPMILVKHKDVVYKIFYNEIKEKRSIKLGECKGWTEENEL